MLFVPCRSVVSSMIHQRWSTSSKTTPSGKANEVRQNRGNLPFWARYALCFCFVFFYLQMTQMDLVFDCIYYLAPLRLTTTSIWRLIFYRFGQSRRSEQIRFNWMFVGNFHPWQSLVSEEAVSTDVKRKAVQWNSFWEVFCSFWTVSWIHYSFLSFVASVRGGTKMLEWVPHVSLCRVLVTHVVFFFSPLFGCDKDFGGRLTCRSCEVGCWA